LIGPADGSDAEFENGAEVIDIVPIARRVDQIMAERGLDRKAALKQAARERGITRREAYKQLLVTRDE
jgi:hypothetical protein